MRLPNQPSLALLKRVNRPVIWLSLCIVSLPIISLAGCSGGAPSMARVTGFFRGSSPAEAPTPAPAISPNATETPAPAAPPVAEETTGHPGKKTAQQARAASENAAAASKAAANASAQAALASKQAATASKQAASVANRVGGSGPTGAEVSLEPNPGAMGAGTPAPAVAIPASTPPGSASVASVAPAPGTSTRSSPALESSGTPDANPEKAAKLILDVDKVEKQIDRKNLSADDSQRDILAQKLLSEAKGALAERDSVAAISLATKASTLLAPLPKLADSAVPSLP
jgi:hypothetical protein